MNILLIGSGGREHALAWKIARSSELTRLFIAPGNPGTVALGENVKLDDKDHPAVVRFCTERAIASAIRLRIPRSGTRSST